MMQTKLVVTLLAIAMVGTVLSCDEHDVKNDTGSVETPKTETRDLTEGSGIELSNESVTAAPVCRDIDTVFVEEEGSPNNVIGSPVKIQGFDTSFILDSNMTPSASDKWRIYLPDSYIKEMIMLIWGNFQNGDHLQMNKRIFRGSSNCTGYPISFKLNRRTILVSIQNKIPSSFFKIKALTPSTDTKGEKGLANLITRCSKVLEYIGDSDDKFQTLQEMMQLSSIHLVQLLNNQNETDLYKCEILTKWKQCEGSAYNGRCAPNAAIPTRS